MNSLRRPSLSGDPAEDERADHLADQVDGADEADLAGVHARVSCANRRVAHDLDLEPVQDPGDAEADTIIQWNRVHGSRSSGRERDFESACCRLLPAFPTPYDVQILRFINFWSYWAMEKESVNASPGTVRAGSAKAARPL